MNDFPQSVVGSHPEVIESLVTLFFKALDDAGIVWAIAHGWYGLPRYARHDIDILVQKGDVAAVECILRKSCEGTGWIIYGSFRNSILWSFWVLLPGKEQAYFQFDVMIESGMRGRPFFRSRRCCDELRRRWRNEDGIWCVSHAFAAASDLLKELIANSRFEGVLRYRHVEDALKQEPTELLQLLSDATGDGMLAGQIVDACRQSDWDGLTRFSVAIRRGFRRYRLTDLPMITRYIYDYIRLRFFSFLRLMIVIIGPDGCGKTTIGDGIERHFRQRPFLNVMRLHSNFSSAIRLRDIKTFILKLFGKKIELAPEPKPGTRGMGMTKPLSRPRSMAYVAYYGLWFAWGYIQLLKWRTFSSIIIADRYYYDYYYMRGHMNSPKWFKDLIGLIVPKPNLIFYLDRSAEEIFKQKPELEIEEIIRQQDMIKALIRKNRRARVIDAAHGVEETIRRVNSMIEEWLRSQRG